MRYTCILKSEKPYIFEFPELECTGETSHALFLSNEELGMLAFFDALNTLRHEKQPIPEGCADGNLYVPVITQIKIRLWNLMHARGMNGMDLAEKMGISRQKVQRILDFSYASDLNRLEEAIEALNADIDVCIR